MASTLVIHDLCLDVPGRRLFDAFRLKVNGGEVVAIVGPSGSGKTSLIRCIAGIERPTTGSITLDGRDITRLVSGQRARFRLEHIGLVFQFGELLPELTVVENVSLPLRLRGQTRQPAEEASLEALGHVHLAARASSRVDELSGGEVQRVGIARALVSQPLLLLADEPTGALDADNTIAITTLLMEQARRSGAGVIIATHDPLVFERADRIIDLRAFTPVSSDLPATSPSGSLSAAVPAEQTTQVSPYSC